MDTMQKKQPVRGWGLKVALQFLLFIRFLHTLTLKMTEIKLRIYEFELFYKVREYHAEIEAYSKSYSYCDEGLEESVVLNKDGLEGYTLISTFELGWSDLFEYEFEYFTRYLNEDFTSEKYHLFRNNCRHYAFNILKVLKPTKGYIGVKILKDLNDMSELLGTFIRLFLLAGIIISFGVCILPEVLKDFLLILTLILLFTL